MFAVICVHLLLYCAAQRHGKRPHRNTSAMARARVHEAYRRWYRRFVQCASARVSSPLTERRERRVSQAVSRYGSCSCPVERLARDLPESYTGRATKSVHTAVPCKRASREACRGREAAGESRDGSYSYANELLSRTPRCRYSLPAPRHVVDVAYRHGMPFRR